jgi:hypothetical protein
MESQNGLRMTPFFMILALKAQCGSYVHCTKLTVIQLVDAPGVAVFVRLPTPIMQALANLVEWEFIGASCHYCGSHSAGDKQYVIGFLSYGCKDSVAAVDAVADEVPVAPARIPKGIDLARVDTHAKVEIYR